MIGVAFFDLLPEAVELGANQFHRPYLRGPGLHGLYLAIDRALALGGSGARRGHLGAGSLTAHSVMDGLAIGLSFQVSAATAAVVTLAVLAHDLSDGINTVNVSLACSRKPTWGLPLADRRRGGAPGRACSSACRSASHATSAPWPWPPSPAFFLVIGASELIPASHQRHPRAWTTLATLAGCASIWLVVRMANLGGSQPFQCR